MLTPTTGSSYIFTNSITQAVHVIERGKIYALRVIATNDVGRSLPSEKLINLKTA